MKQKNNQNLHLRLQADVIATPSTFRVKSGSKTYTFRHTRVTVSTWKLFEMTLRNIGMIDGEHSYGLLFLRKHHLLDLNIVLKQMPSSFGCVYVLLQHMNEMKCVTLETWNEFALTYIVRREGMEEMVSEYKRYYFRRKDGTKFSFTTTEQMFLSMQRSLFDYGVLALKSCDGIPLCTYVYPAIPCAFLDRARRRVMIELNLQQKYSFVKKQIFGMYHDGLRIPNVSLPDTSHA